MTDFVEKRLAPRGTHSDRWPALSLAHGIVLAGSIAYVMPPQAILRVLPYYGGALFALACVVAIPFLVIGGGLRAVSVNIAVIVAGYGLLVGLAMEYVQPKSNAVFSPRVMLDDGLCLLAFVAGGMFASRSSDRLVRLLRFGAVAAAASAALQLLLMTAGLLPSQWDDGSGRIGSPSVYLSLSMALCFCPAAFMAARDTWFGFAVLALQVAAGFIAQTRTLLVTGGALLLLLCARDRMRRTPLFASSTWLMLSLGGLAVSAVALAHVAKLRDVELFDPTGRDEELLSLLQEMTGIERVFGIGSGRGFVRFGVDSTGEEREFAKSTTHLLSGAFLVKFGIPAGVAATLWLFGVCVMGLIRSRSRKEWMLPTFLIACTLVDSALSSLLKPVAMFALGASVELLLVPPQLAAGKHYRASGTGSDLAGPLPSDTR